MKPTPCLRNPRSTARVFVLTLAVLLLAPCLVLAADKLTAHDLLRIKSVTDAKISPDGKHVAYVLSVPRDPFQDKDGHAYAELHVVSAGGASRPFVAGQVNVSRIAWTPDGQRVSFLSKRGADKQTSLYAISLAGGEAEKLLEHETSISAYSWSPDGKQVACLATEPETKDEKDLKEKGFVPQIYEEDARPVRIWLADIPMKHGTKPRLLDVVGGSASDVQWSPAGGKLAVAIAPTPLVDDELMHRKVRVVDVASGKVVSKLDHAAKLGQFAWSPDGKHLATISGEDIHDTQEGRLLLWSGEGKKLRDLLPDLQGHVSSIAWQSNTMIGFVVDVGVWTAVSAVDVEGRAVGEIGGTGQPIFGHISITADGRTAAVIGHTPQHPPEVFLLDRGQARRLTHGNLWLKDKRLARQEYVQHKARDGLGLEGVLIYPLDEKPGQRYPLILAVHGGPEAHVPNGWVTRYAYPGQVAAGEGFAVFYPNYRGSTGRGVKFCKLGQADAAGKEFDDLVDAVDYLIGTGLVDKAKVGITGGSYGGYASAWGATYYSDRFAASVMFVGISNNISKTGTTDIPEEMYLVHHRKRLWEDWDYFLKRSPIYYLDRAKTPLLILHGKDDPRVFPGQSMELYRHLKTRGQAPVRLVLYPGEGHGNRRAASQLDYCLRLMQWMTHYLKGPGGQPPAMKLSYDEAPKQTAGQ
jgi:dipeptidyl aminopeptidase/acylaminoacyl peptidase